MRALKVKSPDACRLAEAIARETGQTITQVVTEALRQRFERLTSNRPGAGVEELRAIAERAGAATEGPYKDHADFLYDERGLPG